MANLKFPVSGSVGAGTTATVITATRTRLLLGATTTPGRVCWLREAWAFCSNAGGAAIVIGNVSTDVTGNSNATAASAEVRMVLHVTGPTGMTVVKIPEPGMLFDSGYGPVVACHVTGATEVWAAGGMGYEM